MQVKKRLQIYFNFANLLFNECKKRLQKFESKKWEKKGDDGVTEKGSQCAS